MDCEICASPKMVCYIHSPPSADPTVGGWRCTCMVYVVPGEEHRCFYRDILAVLDRIAVQLEKRPVPVPEFNLTAAGEIIRKGGL